MPLVKGGAKGSGVGGDPTPQRPTLDSSDAESRWAAARALAGHAEAVPELAAALGRETVPRVREAIMTALIRIGDTASVEAILPVCARRTQAFAQPRSNPCRRCRRL